MKNYFILSSLTVLLFFLMSSSGTAQDLVYKPINPAFGGETFNYQWMLNSAQVQNLIEEPEDDTFNINRGSSLEDFAESLNRQLLNQISRQVVTSQFGEAGLEEGSYTVGNFQIEVNNTTEGLSITILDTALGEQTQVIIPFF